MRAVRAKGKRAFETVAIAAGLDRIGRWLRRGRATVLAYHNVVPDGAPQIGDGSLHLPLRAFARQLDVVCRFGEVVSLKEMLEITRQEIRNRNAFAITFDDGYRGAVTLGVGELERRKLPATIFVAPALLEDQTFWWDALHAAADTRPSELRHRILTEGKGTLEGAKQVAGADALEMRRMPAYSRSATETELKEAVAVGGIAIGSHTWGHASLVELCSDALHDEVARPREWLRDRFGRAYVDVLAYPYGFHSASVERAAREAGYRAGFALAPGSIRLGSLRRANADVFRLPRLNVPSGLSPSGLRIKAAWS